MTAIPTIETERLRLGAWDMRHVEPVGAILRDACAMRFTGGVQTGASAGFDKVAQRIGQWALRGFGPFAVERRDDGTFVGWIGPMFPPGWPEREIGWTLAREHWGHGYATEAARAALRFSYERLGWTTAISVIDPLNVGSQGVARRLGARLEQRDVAVAKFRADVWRHAPAERLAEAA